MLSVPRTILGKWFGVLVWLYRPHYSPLTEHNAGLLMASLLDITPWENTFYLMGLNISPYAVGEEQRKKPQPTFCVSMKLWPHPDIRIWAFFLWTQRMLKISRVGQSGNLIKEQDSYEFLIRLWGIRGLSKGLGASGFVSACRTTRVHFLTSPLSDLVRGLVLCF